MSQAQFQIDYATTGTMDMDIFAGVKKTPTGYAIAGFVNGVSYITGGFPSLLIMTDTSGAFTSGRQYQDNNFIPTTPLLANDLQTTSSGGFIMTGAFGSKAMLLKVNSSGSTTVFSKTYGNSNEFGNAVKELSAGGYIVAGTTKMKSLNPDKDSLSIFVFKTDASGNYTWGRTYTLISVPVFDSQDEVLDAAELSDGYAFAGYNSQNNTTDTTTNILVFKTDFNGTLQWMKSYGDLGSNEGAYSIKLLSNGDLLVGGYTDKVGIASSIAVLEINASNGNIVTSSAYGVGGLADQLGSIQQTSSGFAIVGWTVGLNYKSFLLTLNSTYAPVIAETYNSFIGGIFTKGEKVPGGYVIGSMIGTTSYQLHMIKTDNNGSSGGSCTQASVTPIQYSYSPPVTTITPTVYSVGSSSNCSLSNKSISPTTTVECAVLPLSANAGTNQTICSGTATTIGGSPTASNGTPGYTYSWASSPAGFTSSAANPVVSPTTTTTYTVTVTDATPSTASSSVVVTVNSLPVATAANNGPVCAGTTLSLTGGPASMSSYAWSGPNSFTSTSQNPTVSTSATAAMSGTYTITVTNSNGCKDTISTYVTVKPLPVATATNNGPICVGATLSLTGGPGSMSSYSWSGPLSYTSTTQSPTVSTSATTAMSGTYTLTVTNSSGCKDTISTYVTVNPLPIANAGTNDTLCAGKSTTLNASGGGTYSWGPSTGLSSTTSASPVATPTATTIYTVTVTGGIGCSASASVEVKINPLPIPNLGPDVGTCTGHSINLHASGGGIYAWSPSTGLSCITCANLIASPSDTTTYTVTVTSAAGCSNTDTITVNVYNAPTANAGSNVAICKGSSTTLTASGGGAGGSYSWSPATGLSSSTISNPVASPTATSTYTVTVTDVAGCSATASVNVKVNPLPVANAGTNATICPAGSTTLNATGAGIGGTYSWNPASTLSNANIFDPVASPTVTTIYSVTATDTNGCSNTSNVTITVNVPSASAGSNVSICLGTSTTLHASGGSTYAWSPGTDLSSVTSSTPVANPTTTTTYTVTAINSSGCTASASIVVTVNPLPTANAGSNATICDGASTTLNATGAGVGGTYSWSPATGLSATNINNPIASPTSTTHYSVTVTNANGCTASANVIINVNLSPHAFAGPDTSICVGSSVTLTAGGGGSYHWNTGDTGASVTYTPGITSTYIVTVSYSNGCSSSADVVVTVNSIPPAVTLTENPSDLAYVDQIITFTASPNIYPLYNFYVNHILVQSSSSNVYQTDTLTNNSVVSVTVSKNDCISNIDTILVEIKPIPNAFIPNGDNILNKTFVPGLNLTVFNRWGQKLYEGNDGWDGKFHGTLVSPGTYYYIIKLSNLKNAITEIKKGSVTVIGTEN
ncbi:MAG: gliding motility-associated C-terminal domain-containing protein [Bacteroidales bacterium]